MPQWVLLEESRMNVYNTLLCHFHIWKPNKVLYYWHFKKPVVNSVQAYGLIMK